jgi:Serine aminopeptidase, S33
MKRYLKRIVRGVCIALVVYGAIVAGLIAFGTAKPPPLAPAITKPFADIDIQALPELLRYRARDGALLSYREYRASGNKVAVLLHGSAGSGVDMHTLALALQRAGIAALVPDMRGHGANAPHGDTKYVGQLDDDLADLIASKKPELANSTWTVLGFSSGGAFALRFAAESPAGELVDRYVLVSPYLRYDAPSPALRRRRAGHRRPWVELSDSQYSTDGVCISGMVCRCLRFRSPQILTRRPGPTRGACTRILEPTTIISPTFVGPFVLCRSS